MNKFALPVQTGITCKELHYMNCMRILSFSGIILSNLFLFGPLKGFCPDDWVYGKTKCFLFKFTTWRKWQGAYDFCGGLGAVTLGNGDVIGPSLAFLESPEEFAIFKSHVVPRTQVWMNCNRSAGNATWVCVTDREGTTSSYRGKFRGMNQRD